jgi:ParB family chromosome partitioning protein
LSEREWKKDLAKDWNCPKKIKSILLPPKVFPNPNQPRKNFDEKSSEAFHSISWATASSTNTERETARDSYELICGERRLKAACMAGLEKVPCILKRPDDKTSAVMALSENLLRKDLNFFEEAMAITELMVYFKMTQEEIAAAMGKTQGAVANKLRILRLSDEIKEIVLENHLTERHARLLLLLEDEKSRRHVLKKMIEKKMNVAAAESYLKNYLKEKETPPPEARRKFFPKDIKIFLNTINHAIAVMKKSGIQAKTVENEENDFIEYIIKIPKTIKN